MEEYAFEYSTSKGYTFPKYPDRDGLIAMKDMFDMMAGTSTGSIIAAALSYPSGNLTDEGVEIPQYWYKEVQDVYANQGE